MDRDKDMHMDMDGDRDKGRDRDRYRDVTGTGRKARKGTEQELKRGIEAGREWDKSKSKDGDTGGDKDRRSNTE